MRYNSRPGCIKNESLGPNKTGWMDGQMDGWKKLPIYAQNPLDTFPRNSPVVREISNLLRTCYWETG